MSPAPNPVRATRGPLLAALALLLALAATGLPLRAAVSTSQTFTLQPGWNSIFIEVSPANPDPAVVFAGLPVDQVWAFFPTRSPVQYLSNPSDGLFNVPGWNSYFPAGSRADSALLTDLRGIIGHQAYLVKNTGTAAATLTVMGTAGLQGIKWNPDSFTLTGLAVDPSTTVRSGDFFSGSSAHAGQPRYRLDPTTGTWTALTDTTALAAGQAYWVFTKGGSDFSAPMEVSFGGGRTLDFGPNGESIKLTVRNRSTYAAAFKVANPGNLPLSYQQSDPVNGNVWNLLPASLTLPLAPASPQTIPAGGSTVVTVGVRRLGLTADVAGLLRVSGGGVAVNVPVAAALARSPVSLNGGGSAVNPTTASKVRGVTNRAGTGLSPNGTTTPANVNAGLWVGTATLNAVTEANSATPGSLTATPATFALRLIIHVDDAGVATLLKEVTLMKRKVPAGTVADPASPPNFVLVTDPARLSDFDAPQTRDSSPFASRITSVGFDFAGNGVPLGGDFGGLLQGTVTVDRTLPTNPFRHKYHPDHDGLTPQGVDETTLTPAVPVDQQEVWGVKRQLQLAFVTSTGASPATGYTQRSGNYLETLGGVDSANPGLHKNAIQVAGTFTLRRLNTIGSLNPAP